MSSIAELKHRIEEGLSAMPWDRHPEGLYAPIAFTMKLGGKRMRPLLVLLTTELCGGSPEDALPAALGIELFHNFTLVHDDIMDKAPLRRGRETLYRKFGTNTAILGGDVMFAEACRLVSQVPEGVLKPVLDSFFRTATKVCEGQQLDMEFEQQATVSIPDYLRMISLKTAVLLGCCMEVGALVAHADEDIVRHCYNIGLHLGIAFQLQDDILDTYGTPERFGKQVGGDIVQNKRTFLLLKAMELAGPEEQETLGKWLRSGNFETAEKVAGVKGVFDRLDVYHLACAERDNHFDQAMNGLEQLPLDDDRKNILRSFTEGLLERDH